MTCGSSTAWLCPGNLAEKMGKAKQLVAPNDKKSVNTLYILVENPTFQQSIQTVWTSTINRLVFLATCCQNAHLRLFGAEARIDWAHPVLALDELEQLVRESPEQSLGRKFCRKKSWNRILSPIAKDSAIKNLDFYPRGVNLKSSRKFEVSFDMKGPNLQ